jgi:hypothetical protein
LRFTIRKHDDDSTRPRSVSASRLGRGGISRIGGAATQQRPATSVRSNPAWLTVTTGPTNASQQLPPQLFAITPKSHADELTPFGLDPSRRLGQRSRAPGRKSV